jgi:hypothetical protein
MISRVPRWRDWKDNAETQRTQSSEEKRREEKRREEKSKRAGLKDQRYIEELREEKRRGRSAILSLSSAAAPLGAWFIAERSYRGGISDVDRTRPD